MEGTPAAKTAETDQSLVKSRNLLHCPEGWVPTSIRAQPQPWLPCNALIKGRGFIISFSSFFQRKKLCTAIIATLATTSTLSFAAEQAVPDEVVVVGSRIARGAQAGATPVQVIDRQTIDNSGYNNLQQIFERSTAAGNGTFSARGNNQDSTANGAAAVSLRGMGADATLVLVNRRRVAISSFTQDITTNFVDINNLPVSAIERVEVL